MRECGSDSNAKRDVRNNANAMYIFMVNNNSIMLSAFLHKNKHMECEADVLLSHYLSLFGTPNEWDNVVHNFVSLISKAYLMCTWISNKSSAVAEMGDRDHSRHGPKRGGLLCPFRGGAGSPSNTM